jgi:hypothetical protein
MTDNLVMRETASVAVPLEEQFVFVRGMSRVVGCDQLVTPDISCTPY